MPKKNPRFVPTSPTLILEKPETCSLFSSTGHNFHQGQFNFPKFASQGNGMSLRFQKRREHNECCQAVSKAQCKLLEQSWAKPDLPGVHKWHKEPSTLHVN